MYNKLKLKLVLPVNIKQYRSQEFNLEEYLKIHLTEEFAKRYYDDLGFFIDLDNISKTITAEFDETNFLNLNIKLECTVISYIPELNQLTSAMVERIDERGNLVLDLGFTKGYLHSSQFIDDSFKHMIEKQQLINKDKKIIKANDVLKLRVIELGKNRFGFPNIRMTMRQPNLGKASWWS